MTRRLSEGWNRVTAAKGDALGAPPRRRKRQFTTTEWEAINSALAQCLAGPLDGFNEGSPDEERTLRAMRRAQEKVWERLL